MDPFVVASLGKKVFRTRVVRHNLNPVFDEKMVFQVMRHEQQYSMTFTVVDRDKLSGNDFVASTVFPLQTLVSAAPEADTATGLYALRDPPEPGIATPTPSRSRFRIPMSRNASSTSINKQSLKKNASSNSLRSSPSASQINLSVPHGLAPTSAPSDINISTLGSEGTENEDDDADLNVYEIPLNLGKKDRWEDKHNPVLYVKAKYLPYPALRQQFWRAMLKQYDADESKRVSKVELTTMLDTLGSTLKESTIDGFFNRFAAENGAIEGQLPDLTFDQAVICLEDILRKTSQQRTWGDSVRAMMPHAHPSLVRNKEKDAPDLPQAETSITEAANTDSNHTAIPSITQDELGDEGEEGDYLEPDNLVDERQEEHVVEIRECPLCHQPRLNKRSDADIITHIATCASQDWRQVNNIVMSGFVTSSQAQRKWYSKVITKISYGGYKLGANSANILVQDRLTGQINEERMSVYVRLGIRLLYKGLKSRDMEKKRSKSGLKMLSCGLWLTKCSTQDVEIFEHQTRQEV